MVTPSRHTPAPAAARAGRSGIAPPSAAGALRRGARWLGFPLALLLLGIGLQARPAAGQEATLMFLTLKEGEQAAGGGTLLGTLSAAHGPALENRTAIRRGVELDIYAVTRSKFGLAVGLEVMDYLKTFSFSDPSGALPPERLRLDARSFLYTLKGFLRFGDFLPFIGIGSGTYYVSYNEELSQLSFLDSSIGVLAYRVGFRWLLVGRLGLLVEAGEISAPIQVFSNNAMSTLDLGGSFFNAGLSYVW